MLKSPVMMVGVVGSLRRAMKSASSSSWTRRTPGSPASRCLANTSSMSLLLAAAPGCWIRAWSTPLAAKASSLLPRL